MVSEGDTSIQSSPTSSAEAGKTVDGTESTNTMFRVTAGLVAGYFIFVILGAAISSNALIGLGVICVLISLITMYVDLRDLQEPLWNTRPILWVIGALLLYIVVAPLYVYKRRQAA